MSQHHLKLRAKLAVSTRDGADEETLGNLRRDLRAANLERAIRETVDALPPLTPEQRAELSALLNG